MKGLETFVDWFSGIGGFRIGAENNGLKCVASCDHDKHARQTYAKNFGHEPEFSDARDVVASEVPDHDLFTGGFPCQSFSTAGKKLGFQDSRGTLFFEICRVLEAKHPNYFLLENVKGLLQAPMLDESHKPIPETAGWVFYRMLESLGHLGYSVQWQVLDCRHWVAQHRERVYIIGNSGAVPVPQVFPLFDASREMARSQGGPRNIGSVNKNRVQGSRVYDTGAPSLTLDTGRCTPLVETPWRSEPLGNLYQSKRYSHPYQGGRVYGPGNIAPTLDTSKNTLLDTGTGIRVLTPLERERLMGFPEGWTEGVSDEQRYRQTGNAVCTKVTSEVLYRLVQCHANGGDRPEEEA